MPGQGPAALLSARVRAAGSPPLVTWYDDATGERVELSAVSLANWVAKAASLLADDLSVEPGEVVGVRLPEHWQTAAVLLGLWTAGAVADPAGGDHRVQVVHEVRLAEPGMVAAEHVLALSLRPLGARLGPLPAGAPPQVLDFAVEVPPQPDVWTGPLPGPQDAALVRGGGVLTGADLVAEAAALGAPQGARVLIGAADAGPPAYLLPLVCGGSLVLVGAENVSGQAARVAAERVTHVLTGTGLAPA